jgi:hypothetical protein
MTVSVFATKLEMKSADTAVVSVVIVSDLGPMQFDLPVKVEDGVHIAKFESLSSKSVVP